jgi:cytochrome c oxidase subunit 2
MVLVVAVILGMMVPRLAGEQKTEGDRYTRITDSAALDRTFDLFIEKWQVGEHEGLSVVAPAPGEIIYLRAGRFSFTPVLQLVAGVTYQLRLFSGDTIHGYQIPGVKLRYEIIPGYLLESELTVAHAGEYLVLCDEFCGDNHHLMTTRLTILPATPTPSQ